MPAGLGTCTRRKRGWLTAPAGTSTCRSWVTFCRRPPGGEIVTPAATSRTCGDWGAAATVASGAGAEVGVGVGVGVAVNTGVGVTRIGVGVGICVGVLAGTTVVGT